MAGAYRERPLAHATPPHPSVHECTGSLTGSMHPRRDPKRWTRRAPSAHLASVSLLRLRTVLPAVANDPRRASILALADVAPMRPLTTVPGTGATTSMKTVILAGG